MDESYALSPPHRLVRSREITSQAGQSQSLILNHRQGHDYELKVKSGNETQVRPWNGLDHTLGDSFAIDIWTRDERKPR